MPLNRNYPSKTSPSLRWGRWLLWSVAFVGAATLSAIAGVTVATIGPLPKSIVRLIPNAELAEKIESKSSQNAWKSLLRYQIERPVNILVMGIDRVLEAEAGSEEAFSGNSDTMLLLRFDPRNNSVRMLSIPRDTQVFIPEIGTTKINDANVQGGAPLAVEVVSETLNDVPIDRYVRVTNDAFRELVDLVGGIEVEVPYAMRYKDETQQLDIDLEAGKQILDGDKAEQFARFRMDEYGDIGRVQRQQVLLKSLRQRLQNPTVLPRLPKAIGIMEQFVDTNLSLEEMLALVGFGLSLEKNDIQMVLLPGRFSETYEFEGISYWILSEEGRDRVAQNYFEQSSDSLTASEPRDWHRIRIAIQNTTDDPEVAQEAATYLRDRDFSNVYISKRQSTRKLKKTEIVVQRGNRSAARQLQQLLGFGRIESDSTGDIGSELTLRVGDDWSDRPQLTDDIAPGEN
ncbi:LCP family protein [Lusitaniella coriacea]|uniref:LCP family protein n=1 Tax=Lusitaniella coriacea TaxID=1983105 RepID=UPI003CFB8D19